MMRFFVVGAALILSVSVASAQQRDRTPYVTTLSARFDWGRLKGSEADAIKKSAAAAAKRTITIICNVSVVCDPLSVDLAKAFSEAGWTVARRRDLDTRREMIASSKELVEIINGSTGGRFRAAVADLRVPVDGEYISMGERTPAAQ